MATVKKSTAAKEYVKALKAASIKAVVTKEANKEIFLNIARASKNEKPYDIIDRAAKILAPLYMQHTILPVITITEQE